MDPTFIQTGLALVAGQTYKLTFNADITTGLLKVYQGTQLVYNTSIVALSSFDKIKVSERVYMDRRDRIYLFETVNVSENVIINVFFPIDYYDTVTVTENITINII